MKLPETKACFKGSARNSPSGPPYCNQYVQISNINFYTWKRTVKCLIKRGHSQDSYYALKKIVLIFSLVPLGHLGSFHNLRTQLKSGTIQIPPKLTSCMKQLQEVTQIILYSYFNVTREMNILLIKSNSRKRKSPRTWLVARKDFIIFSSSESFKSYTKFDFFPRFIVNYE